MDSLQAGYRWYAVTFHNKTKMEWDERNSPKFRTKAECREHALDIERMNSTYVSL